jgi:hypothetical protein
MLFTLFSTNPQVNCQILTFFAGRERSQNPRVIPAHQQHLQMVFTFETCLGIVISRFSLNTPLAEGFTNAHVYHVYH